MTGDAQKVEFSRRIEVDRIGSAGLTETVSATAAERKRLAKRLGLGALRSLEGKLTLSRRPGGLIRLDGEVAADVAQTCVVTLEPFESRVTDAFTLFFAELRDGEDPGIDVDMLDDEAWPEAVDRGAIDLGETVAQQLSLALDPHPRAPGAALEVASAGEDVPADNPFHDLSERLAGKKRDA